ncbi:hypothetical protein KCU90_g151, partial [Aureobasidium melanogenum]
MAARSLADRSSSAQTIVRISLGNESKRRPPTLPVYRIQVGFAARLWIPMCATNKRQRSRTTLKAADNEQVLVERKERNTVIHKQTDTSKYASTNELATDDCHSKNKDKSDRDIIHVPQHVSNSFCTLVSVWKMILDYQDQHTKLEVGVETKELGNTLQGTRTNRSGACAACLESKFLQFRSRWNVVKFEELFIFGWKSSICRQQSLFSQNPCIVADDSEIVNQLDLKAENRVFADFDQALQTVLEEEDEWFNDIALGELHCGHWAGFLRSEAQ